MYLFFLTCLFYFNIFLEKFILLSLVICLIDSDIAIIPMQIIEQRRIQNCPASKTELFTKIVNGWKPSNIFGKSSILDDWHGLKYISVESPVDTQPKLNVRRTIIWGPDGISHNLPYSIYLQFLW